MSNLTFKKGDVFLYYGIRYTIIRDSTDLPIRRTYSLQCASGDVVKMSHDDVLCSVNNGNMIPIPNGGDKRMIELLYGR